MDRVKELISNPRALLPSLCISLLLSLCGNLVFPELYKAGTGGAAVAIRPLPGAFAVLVAYFLTIVFFALLFAGISPKEKRV
ncbi:MAG: hypothetical protein LBL63_02445, partial [Clostridiales Family XIII bacterium]|nr:hypothetical protein [Clostridiales Family XIII bacterium]